MAHLIKWRPHLVAQGSALRSLLPMVLGPKGILLFSKQGIQFFGQPWALVAQTRAHPPNKGSCPIQHLEVLVRTSHEWVSLDLGLRPAAYIHAEPPSVVFGYELCSTIDLASSVAGTARFEASRYCAPSSVEAAAELCSARVAASRTAWRSAAIS